MVSAPPFGIPSDPVSLLHGSVPIIQDVKFRCVCSQSSSIAKISNSELFGELFIFIVNIDPGVTSPLSY